MNNKKPSVEQEPQEGINWIVVGPLVGLLVLAFLYVTFWL